MFLSKPWLTSSTCPFYIYKTQQFKGNRVYQTLRNFAFFKVDSQDAIENHTTNLLCETLLAIEGRSNKLSEGKVLQLRREANNVPKRKRCKITKLNQTNLLQDAARLYGLPYLVQLETSASEEDMISVTLAGTLVVKT